jgi:hypothetical protein
MRHFCVTVQVLCSEHIGVQQALKLLDIFETICS